MRPSGAAPSTSTVGWSATPDSKKDGEQRVVFSPRSEYLYPERRVKSSRGFVHLIGYLDGVMGGGSALIVVACKANQTTPFISTNMNHPVYGAATTSKMKNVKSDSWLRDGNMRQIEFNKYVSGKPDVTANKRGYKKYKIKFQSNGGVVIE